MAAHPSGAVVEHPDVGGESGRQQTVPDERLQLLREVLRRQAPTVPLLLQVMQQGLRAAHL